MMDKQTKSHYLLKGMLAEFQTNPHAKLLNKMVGIKFKEIRLEKKITAEKVVDDNKTRNISDVTLSFTFFSSDYYKKDKTIWEYL